MSALRVERDGEAPPRHARAPRAPERLRRRPDPGARRRLRRRRRRPRRRARRRGPELLRRRRRRVAALLDRPLLRGERRGLPPPVPDAPGDLPLPRAGGRPCPGLRARRRLRPDRLRGHLHRRGGCGVRVLRGAAGDHPRRDLADGAGEDRPGRGPAILPHRRAFRRPRLRCESDWSTRSPPTRTRRWPVVVDSILAGGPTAVREAKRLVLEPGEEEDLLARAAERRTSAEGQEGLRAFLDSRGGERVHPAWHPDRV